MQHAEESVTTTRTTHDAPRCPLDQHVWSEQKTAREIEPPGLPAIERDEQGVWHVHSFEMGRTILRSLHTAQAGFNADLIRRVPQMSNVPILYQEGKEHQLQRKQTARYFAPKTVSDNYRSMMEKLADQLIKKFKRQRRADLSDISLKLAVGVASQVVGLTNSYPGLASRLIAFFDNPSRDTGSSWGPQHLLYLVRNRLRMLLFFYLDVIPAIRARKRHPQDDVISHLISRHYSDLEILTECVTYGAAGMITTREFICVAAWHLLERPALLQRYLDAPEEERYEILHEILRLEPVVAHLQRRATDNIEVESEGRKVVIPRGDIIDIHIYGTNTDEQVVGEYPLMLCPGRELKGKNIPSMLMSFGDGAHRCPGAYIAIQETDIFLHRLLAIEDLRVVSKPSVSWDDMIGSYEIRNFNIAIDS